MKGNSKMNSISVIVPVYYGEKYIENMICQIEACRDYLKAEDCVELIFVNDAPAAPLPTEWNAETVRVIVMNTDSNVGMQGARIKGLKHCQGEYVLFLDQDDLVRPEYLYSQLMAIENNDASVCRAIHENTMWYSGENIFEKTVSKEYMLGMQCGRNPIASPGQVLLRKASIPDTWMKNILKHRGGDDWFLWLCMLSEQCTFSLNQDVLFEHVVHKNNFSNHVVEMLETEQEVIHIVQEKKLFSDNDLILLHEGFFKRNVMRLKGYDSLRIKWAVLEKWMQLKEKHIKLSEHLHREGCENVAIYGCAVLGQMTYDELKNDIDVKYFIDKNADVIEKEIPVFSLQEKLPEVDGIIITLIDEAEKVKENIINVLNCKTFILKDWIMMCKPEDVLK